MKDLRDQKFFTPLNFHRLFKSHPSNFIQNRKRLNSIQPTSVCYRDVKGVKNWQRGKKLVNVGKKLLKIIEPHILRSKITIFTIHFKDRTDGIHLVDFNVRIKHDQLNKIWGFKKTSRATFKCLKFRSHLGFWYSFCAPIQSLPCVDAFYRIKTIPYKSFSKITMICLHVTQRWT